MADIALEDGLEVCADADHVRRILINLLTNADKYGRPPVRVVAARGETAVEIRVSDAGDGIPAEFRARLFDKFTRRPDHHDIEGTGLGLSIVQGVAHVNGGDASYEHEVKGGASTSGCRRSACDVKMRSTRRENNRIRFGRC